VKPWVRYVAIAGGAVLLLKAVIVVASDDEVLTSTTAWMYLAGLLLAAAAAIGYAMGRPRHRVLSGVVLVLALVGWVIGIGDLLTPLFEAFSDSKFLADEGPIGVLGVVLLVLGTVGSLSSREPLTA
jgi:thiol:disulfide interchange protein